MFLGAIVTVLVITAELGGFGWWPSAWPVHWAEPRFLPSANSSRSLLGAFVSMLVWTTCTAGSDQMSIQRYLATRDAAAARRSFAIQLVANLLVGILLALAGLAVLGYFHAHPEALKPGWSLTRDADQLMPHFIVIGLPPGVTGLVIAAILAAAMSSLSSGMNSSSAVIVTDFIGRAAGKTMTTGEEVKLARYASLLVGGVAVVLSLVVGGLAENLLDLCFKVVNLLTAPIFVLFFLALFVPRATPFAAVAATVASVTAAAAMAFGEKAWILWSPPAGLAAGVVVGTLASWVSGTRKAVKDPATVR
jgi:SSS family solute:Na+ symporter